MQFSDLSIHDYIRKPEKLRENSGKNGVYNSATYSTSIQTGTKLPWSDSTTLPWSLGHTSHLGTILIVILVPIRECKE